MSNINSYITAKQAALGIGVSYSRMRQLLNQGRIRGAIKFQRDWMVPAQVEILPRPTNKESTTNPS